GLGHGGAAGVHGLRLRGLGDHEVVLDPPAPLGHARPLADAAAEVVELRPPDVAAGHDLEPLDLGRVDRERPLDADAERLLADGEGLARALAAASYHDPLEHLGSPARALDHLEVDPHPIARAEARDPPELLLLDLFDDRAHKKRRDPHRAGAGSRARAW